MNFEDIDWEQRRYELTRAAIEGLSANCKDDESVDDIAEKAIDTAEATLSLLMDKTIAGLWATANKPTQEGRKCICIWNDRPIADPEREGSWTDCDELNLLCLNDNRPFPFLKYEDGPVRLDDMAKLRERRQKEEWKPCGDTEELRRNKIRTAAYDSMQTAVCDLIPPKSLRVTLRQFWSAWKNQMTLCNYSDAELYQKTQFVTGFQRGAEWADKNPKNKL